MASLPHRIDCGPRRISMRSASSRNRLAKPNPPAVEEGSDRRMPSSTITVWPLSAPRMRSEVTVPYPPLRDRLMPGVRSRISLSAIGWASTMASSSSTVTLDDTRSCATVAPGGKERFRRPVREGMGTT